MATDLIQTHCAEGQASRIRAWRFWGLLAAIVLAGLLVRICPPGALPWLRNQRLGYQKLGYDASLYRGYALQLEQLGLKGYRRICSDYVKRQKSEKIALLPPTRFLYVACGCLWKKTFFGAAPPAADSSGNEFLLHDPMARSLRAVSCLFSVLLFALSGVAAGRLLGRSAVCGVLGLFAFDPLQLHMAQNLLIDGFFSFWAMLALWLLWERLQRPGSWGWLAAYAASLAAMVLTKENAAFVFIGLAGLIVLNHWLRFGRVDRWLLAATALGPALGVLTLRWLAGNWGTLITIYQLLVRKTSVTPYAIDTGDGPWYRYLLDLFTISPLIFLLAVGAVYALRREQKGVLFLLLFSALSYLIMCNVRYGMNLRYATIWSLPLCALAWTQLESLGARLVKYRAVMLAAAVAFIGLYNLRQYYIISMSHHAHELTPRILLRALNILKGNEGKGPSPTGA